MIKLSVLTTSSEPVYKQLYDQISCMILSGELKVGTALPPIRTVSKELGVSVITVRNAWDALILDGFVESKAGSGCYVAVFSKPELERRINETLKRPVADLVKTAKQLGVEKPTLVAMIEKEYLSL